MKEKDIKDGFTIVEVALVLAIAGLIFLMAFIAVPAVQRTQRDARRRDDIGTVLTAIQKYQNNNRGALPSGDGLVPAETEPGTGNSNDWTSFYNSFLGNNFMDPIGFQYHLNIVDCGSSSIGAECGSTAGVDEATFGVDEDEGGIPAYTMYVVKSAACDGSSAIGSGNPRKVAVVYKMEGAGAYCANLQ